MAFLKKSFIFLLLIVFISSCHVFNKSGSSNTKKVELSPREKLEVTAILIDAEKEKFLGNYEKSATLFAKCITKDPNNGAAMYELAKIFKQGKNFGNAITLAKGAIKTDQKNEWYQLELADIYQQSKNYKEAIVIYNNLIKQHPENLDYYYDLASLCIYNGKFLDAIKTYDLIEEKTGLSEETSLQKHNIYIYLKKPLEAIKELQAISDKFPHETKYLGYIADIYLKNKMLDKAFETYNKILAIDPNNSFVLLSLADYYKVIGNKDKSYEYIKLAFANPYLEIDTKMNILLQYYAITEVNSDLKEQAFTLVKILVETHPNEAKSHSIYGDYLYREKQFKEALNEFEKVVAIDSGKYIVWEQMLIISAEMNDYKSMLDKSSRVLELFPEQPLPYLFNGIANYQYKMFDKSLESLNNGIKLVVENNSLLVQFYTYIGDSYNQLKNNQLSDEAFDKALEIDSKNSYILNNYSYYLSLRAEKLDKAEKMSQKANELNPNSSSYQDTYSWVFFKSAKFDEAKKWIEKALVNGGDKSAVIVEHYGDILFKLGNNNLAIENWIKAKSLGKGSDLLEKKINDKKYYE
jgi:tetratricopeptide (TPR) repeat protein